MAVGNTLSQAGVNANLGAIAVSLRALMHQIEDFAAVVTAQGASGLQAIGFSATDAATAVQLVNYLSNIAGCYYGTVQQGGSGGTGAIKFNFDSALCAAWGDG